MNPARLVLCRGESSRHKDGVAVWRCAPASAWWAMCPNDTGRRSPLTPRPRQDGMRAQTVDCSTTGKHFSTAAAQCLAPTLKARDIVAVDNFSAYKGAGHGQGDRSARHNNAPSAQILIGPEPDRNADEGRYCVCDAGGQFRA
jgi:hypothetical protein